MMNLNLLHSYDERFITINSESIEMFKQAHFTKEEWESISSKSYLNRINFILKTPFNEIIQFPVLNFTNTTTTVHERLILGYLARLALLQRYRFPLEYSMQFRNEFGLEIENLQNFQIISSAFDEHYLEWFPLNENDKNLIELDKQRILSIALRFWLSGYGVVKGLGYDSITPELVIELGLKYKNNTERTIRNITFFSFLLSKVKDSLFTEPVKFRDKMDFYELEERIWEQNLLTLNSELISEIKNYVFGFLLKRTTKNQLQNYVTSNGEKRTISYKKIEPNYWNTQSQRLRKLCFEFFFPSGIHTIQDVLDGKTLSIFADLLEDVPNKYSTGIVSSFRNWLDYYINEHQLNVNKKRLLPPVRIGTSDTQYGSHINFRQAVRLIEVLYDDQSPYHEDNKINYFRLRRSSLLLLETAKRVHELSVLKYNCLNTNTYADNLLQFHKTKTKKSHTIKISLEAVKWVEQLQKVAPVNPIEISTREYRGGDDLKVRRLLADGSGQLPFNAKSVTKYLVNLQAKIWGENLPGGRFLTAHDLRRLCATYLKIKGNTDEEIAEQLGHDNLQSQFTYTLTIPNDILESFNEIVNEGIYGIKEVDDVGLEPNGTLILDENKALRATSMIVDTFQDEETAKSFLDKLMLDLENFEFTTEESQVEGEIPRGFPMRTHNCNAHSKVTCFHHTLKCYKCKKYSPDLDMLLEHKAELVRWAVFLHHNENMLKKSKDLHEKRTLPVRITDIKGDLVETFIELFHKFELTESECKNIEKEVYQKEKTYISKYYKKFPSPTVTQMINFLKKGVI